MAKKALKICPPSVVSRETQLKTVIRCHFIPPSITKIK
jgi:hypothetical protein